MMLLSTALPTAQALQIALYGMLGIFGVLGVIMIAVMILNKVTGKKKTEEDEK